jgi:hypothetical protein
MTEDVKVTWFSGWIGVSLSLVLLVGCAPGPTVGVDQVPPQLTFEDLSFRVYRGPALTALGRVRQASFRRDTSDATGVGISVRFPRTATRTEALVEAGAASGNLRERRLFASSGVRSVQAGEVATTEEAHYSAADGLVRGEKPIRVEYERFSASGPGFTLDPRDQLLVIVGGAKAVAGEERP